MTPLEKKIANALSPAIVTYLPGSFHKKFAGQLPNWHEREMTEPGRKLMLEMLHRYRRQIRNYQQLCLELEIEKKKNHENQIQN